MPRLRLPEALQKRLRRRSRHDGLVGVYLSDSGFSLGVMDAAGETLRACVAEEYGERDPAEALAEQVEALGLDQARAIIVLDDALYQLLHVEAPAVPPEEMAEALRWRLGDLIDYPPDEAVIATLPQHSDRGTSNTIFALVARRQHVDGVVQHIVDAGLEPEAVEVRETALRNLTRRIPDEAGGTATIHFCREDGVILLTRGDRLYLTRRLESGIGRLESGDSMALDGIALELQRSLDYYERQLATAPASRALVAPTPMDRGPLIDHINANLSVPASALELSHVVDIDCEADADTLARATLAVGGALRDPDSADVSLHTGARYHPEPFRSRVLAGWLLAWTVLLGLGGSGWLFWQTLDTEDRLASARAERQALEERREAAIQRLEQRAADPELEERLSRTQAELAGQKRFRDALDQLPGVKTRGFGPALAALAEAPPSGLWLRRFTLTGAGQARFDGSALQPSRIPDFVDGLSAREPFQASRFSHIAIQRRAERNILDFRLSSQGLADTGSFLEEDRGDAP